MPGVSLTTAVRELSTQHLISGVARLAGAVMTLLKLAFGTLAATQLCNAMHIIPITPIAAPIPDEAPVTTATFPSICDIGGLLYLWSIFPIGRTIAQNRVKLNTNYENVFYCVIRQLGRLLDFDRKVLQDFSGKLPC